MLTNKSYKDVTEFILSDNMRNRITYFFGHSFDGLKIFISSKLKKENVLGTAQGDVIYLTEDYFNFSDFLRDWILGHELTHIHQQALAYSDKNYQILNSEIEAHYQGFCFASKKGRMNSSVNESRKLCPKKSCKRMCWFVKGSMSYFVKPNLSNDSDLEELAKKNYPGFKDAFFLQQDFEGAVGEHEEFTKKAVDKLINNGLISDNLINQLIKKSESLNVKKIKFKKYLEIGSEFNDREFFWNTNFGKKFDAIETSPFLPEPLNSPANQSLRVEKNKSYLYLALSHYGPMQFLHSMDCSNNDTELNKRKVKRWAELCVEIFQCYQEKEKKTKICDEKIYYYLKQIHQENKKKIDTKNNEKNIDDIDDIDVLPFMMIGLMLNYGDYSIIEEEINRLYPKASEVRKEYEVTDSVITAIDRGMNKSPYYEMTFGDFFAATYTGLGKFNSDSDDCFDRPDKNDKEIEDIKKESSGLIALGTSLHMLQDSFCQAHAKRIYPLLDEFWLFEKETDLNKLEEYLIKKINPIIVFTNYNMQDSDFHKPADLFIDSRMNLEYFYKDKTKEDFENKVDIDYEKYFGKKFFEPNKKLKRDLDSEIKLSLFGEEALYVSYVFLYKAINNYPKEEILNFVDKIYTIIDQKKYQYKHTLSGFQFSNEAIHKDLEKGQSEEKSYRLNNKYFATEPIVYGNPEKKIYLLSRQINLIEKITKSNHLVYKDYKFHVSEILVELRYILERVLQECQRKKNNEARVLHSIYSIPGVEKRVKSLLENMNKLPEEVVDKVLIEEVQKQQEEIASLTTYFYSGQAR